MGRFRQQDQGSLLDRSAKHAEKIKAHIQIPPNLNPPIIRKDRGSWESGVHRQQTM